MIRLLAFSPSGEAYFTRDADGRVWQHLGGGSLDPITVNEMLVDRVVTEHGYTRVEEDVQTWGDVDRLVRDSTSKVDMPDLPINPVAARALLSVMDRWLSTPDDRELVTPLVNRLLSNDEVSADAQLRHELLQRSTAAAASSRSWSGLGPSTAPSPGPARHSSVTEYFATAA